MEIIHELESSTRGVYTGAIGYIAPNNDFSFSVPIRTLEISRQNGAGKLGVGGGILHESRAEDEWDECMLKAEFLTGLNTDFSLIETFHYNKICPRPERLDKHLARMEKSANYFHFPFDHLSLESQIRELLDGLEARHDYKIRLLLNHHGKLETVAEIITASQSQTRLRICISPLKINATSIFRRHKTTRRDLYNCEFKRIGESGYYDVLFLNEHGRLAEASRHNLFIENEQGLFTPPIEEGALPGVMRATLLNDPVNNIAEKPLTLEDLASADRIFLSNSVRGLVEVEYHAETR